MNINQYQAKYFAFELLKRSRSDSADKYGATLMDAKVDLNPHQVEAALFAFKSPLSQGAILADEVGLGKTIEAGIVLSQKWAERKRRILIICPSSLRKQWINELADKFYLPSEAVEASSFNKKVKEGNRNPFDNINNIQICSYHFARNKADYIQLVSWDLVVIDEAHYLRNVYKTGNRIAKEIQRAIFPFKKLLLTATPLQNRLEELYGLVSFVDNNIFGDIKSFRKNYISKIDNAQMDDLRSRISPVCHRTLRRQVREYVNYKARIPFTQYFEPTNEEKELYEGVLNYLRRETIYALPLAQRHLMTSVLLKLLASSSFAIANTLERLIKRLKETLIDANKERRDIDLFGWIQTEYESYDDEADEWDDNDENLNSSLTDQDIYNIEKEIEELEYYCNLAQSIEHNEKGEKLIIALNHGFEKLKELGANKKAIIFTESTRTQKYLFERLNQTEYKGKVVLFNGSNNDILSSEIYNQWKTNSKNINKLTGSKNVDIRNAIVDAFKSDSYEIMIATEAASEGINLQFCSMVVNYDLPWNPQRIEQRIGRCHRYGQEFDVVVVNFLNSANAADRRVFQLLDEKFKLFNGVFGSSDEVLGVVENGIDFEKKLTEIYKRCRTKEEIEESFDRLQNDLEEHIKQNMRTTQSKLFENFDMQVIQKLKTTYDDNVKHITKYEKWLWSITYYYLNTIALFDSQNLSFELKSKILPSVPKGWYSLDKKNDEAIHYRLSGDLAQNLLEKAQKEETPVAHLSFDFSTSNIKYEDIEKLKSKSGVMKLVNMQVLAKAEEADIIIFGAMTDAKEILNDDICQFLFTLPCAVNTKSVELDGSFVEKAYNKQKQKHLEFIKLNDTKILKNEINKFEKWAIDRIEASEVELKDVKKKIRDLNRELNQGDINADAMLSIQENISRLERKKRKLRQSIFDKEDAINDERDSMIDEARLKMERTFKEEELFTIRWEII